MRTLIVASLAVLTVIAVSAQTIHELPFASRDNTLDLAIENTASLHVNQLKVTVQNLPAWINFRTTEFTIGQLAKGEEKSATFVFSIDKTAPVKKAQKLAFVISGPNNQSWTKEITVSVAPPDKFELFQNYPNPFNPVTTISYQLTADSKVSLRIYNLIGQEVATLMDGDQTVGFHQETWNASLIASGTYIYRLVAKDASGKETVERKTMTVLK